jgi:hypothetical protein
MTARLDTGNPLTYDWLNALFSEVDAISKTVNVSSGTSKIIMQADHMAKTSSVQVITGSATISIGKGQNYDKDPITFGTPFANKDVMVIPAVNFVNSAEGVFATAWATNITQTGCTIKARIIGTPDKKKSTTITINYIAIGKAKV